MANFTQIPKLSDDFVYALQLAANAHRFQIRKQGEIPYISHLMSVSALVLEAGGNETEAVTALLHDYLEDINTNGKQLLVNKFGLTVYRMIKSLSADTYDEYVQKIQSSDDSVKLISCADKLHNLRNYMTTGRSLWQEKHFVFYQKLYSIYKTCDRIPRHWIDEISAYLYQLEPVEVDY